MYTVQIRQEKFCGTHILLVLFYFLLFLSPGLKEYVALDPGKKLTHMV